MHTKSIAFVSKYTVKQEVCRDDTTRIIYTFSDCSASASVQNNTFKQRKIYCDPSKFSVFACKKTRSKRS